MNNIIEMDNSYYIKKLNKSNEMPVNTIDISDLSLIKVLKNKNINNEDDACITHHIHSKWSRPDIRTQHPRPVLLNTL